MKKLLLFSALLLSIVFVSNGQYNGCEFTTQPDSSCIILNTWNYSDTLETTKGINSTSSYKKILTNRLFVRCWKTPTTATSKTNKVFIVADKTTGQTYSVSKDTAVAMLGITNVTPTYNYGVTRAITSTSFTPSTTQPYRVTYNITIACTATIGSTASGKLELQYYNGTSWVTINEIFNSNTVTLAIALNSVNTQTVSVSGEFAKNTQLRLASTIVGTTTITYVRGTEIFY